MALSKDQLEEIRATWKVAYDDVGTSTLAYRALVQVPLLLDEIDQLREFLDEDQLKRYHSEAYQEWRSQQ